MKLKICFNDSNVIWDILNGKSFFSLKQVLRHSHTLNDFVYGSAFKEGYECGSCRLFKVIKRRTKFLQWEQPLVFTKQTPNLMKKHKKG